MSVSPLSCLGFCFVEYVLPKLRLSNTFDKFEGTRSIIESLQRTNLLPSWSQWSRWCRQVIGQNGQGARCFFMGFSFDISTPPQNTKSTSCWTNFAVAGTLPVVSDPFSSGNLRMAEGWLNDWMTHRLAHCCSLNPHMTCAREDDHDQHVEWHVAGIFRRFP